MIANEIINHVSYQYAFSIVNREVIAGKYIIKACKKFIDDIDKMSDPDFEYTINMKLLKKIEGLTGLINMPTGLRVGIPASEALTGFQWFFIVNALCWVHKDNAAKRRYEKSVLLIARKNGKSFLTALMILLLMMIEPNHSEFYSVAPDKDLSSIIKKEITKMLDASPAINKYFKTVLKEVRFEIAGHKTKFEPLATSNDRMDGRLATAFVADEVGALKTSYPIEAMESSQLNVLNRTGILISTAYDTTSNPMVDQVEYAQKVLDGVVPDDTLFALLYKPDNMKNWTSDEALLQANPLAIEIEENLKELKKMRSRAIEMISKQTNFKTKHLNIFVDGDIADVYVSVDDLRKCKIDSFDWHGKEVYIGVDLSKTTDNTAVSMMAYDRENEKFVVKVWAFLPEGNIESKIKTEKVDYRIMQKNGFCYFSGEKSINYKHIEDFVMNLESEYGVIIKNIGYDTWNAKSSAGKWHDEGFEVTEIKQHSSVLHPATKLLKECILNEKFAYEKNRLFEMNVANAREVLDNNLNGYVNKKKSTGKIDMLAATINAMVLWNAELIEGESVYNGQREEGFLVL